MSNTNIFNYLIVRDVPPRDRRRSPRYPTVENWAFLAWREGGRTRISPARLLNISGVGVFVLAGETPDQGQPAWLRLDEPTVTGWVKANIVRHKETLMAGLEFLEHCSEEFFQAATQSAPSDATVSQRFADGYRSYA
jgi:hypothetical protein